MNISISSKGDKVFMKLEKGVDGISREDYQAILNDLQIDQLREDRGFKDGNGGY